MKNIREKLLAIFQGEHQEYSGQIRLLLRRILEAEAPGPALDEAFRRAHSLKGAARAVGLDEIETVSHRLEALFARAREGSLRIDQGVVEVIHDALDCSEDLLAHAGGSRPAAGAPKILSAIDELLATVKREEPAARERLAGSASPESASGPDSSLPPPASPGREGEPEGSEAQDTPASEPSIRLRASHVDRLLRTCDQLATASPQHRATTRAFHHLMHEIGRLAQHWEILRKSDTEWQRRANPGLAPRRRPLDEMDRKIRSVHARSRRLLLEQQRNTLSLHRFSDDLRADLWKARMTPASDVSEGFGNMVRELARAQQKVVRFRTVGLETEVDREVLQALREPVMHLLRNAVSHGIEPPAERERSGKPSAGQITLSVEAAGGVLTLRVRDDGRGIDVSRIAEEARRRGIVEEPDHSQGEDWLRQLIFEPGFSTAASLSEISGRGMGLSVVQETVRRLHGDLKAESEPGAGTQIVVRAPLSVLTQRVLLTAAAGGTYAFSLRTVERVTRVSPGQIETIEGHPAVPIGKRLVPLASLAATLGLPPAPQRAPRTVPLVVVESGGQSMAFSVDELLDQREALVKDLGIPEAARGVALGGILLEGGSVAILLNVPELLKCAQAPSRVSEEPASQPEEQRQRRILLADDSITTRALEKGILEVHGYEVLAAVDGVEALGMLRTYGADLVISDVQMPRMDGFELLEQIRNDKRLRHTPVIILTSLERHEEQEKGLALGADAYIVKRKFDQRELLEAIQQIL